MSKKYIAYGSNLSVEQMAFRCPEAKIIGMAAIQDWKLVFRTHATIEPAAGRVVPVLIWEITDRDEKNLDLYEGFPSYYFKQEITAMVYLMEEGHDIRVPYRGYLDTLAEGYRRFGFNPYQLELAMKEAKEAMR